MKTVVTGGAGFIGSNLVKKLLDQGRQVAIADDFSRGCAQNLTDLNIQPSDVGENSTFRKKDMKNYKTALEVTRGADTVYHLAARIGNINFLHGTDLIEFEALTTNLVIDANVIKASLENGVKKLVFASSIAVYPVDTQNSRYDVVMSEDSLDCYNPEGGYGWGKLLGEIELGMASGLKVGIGRIYNMYGENSHVGNQQHVVVDLMQKAMRYPQVPFDVWGDGRQSRDFLHVSDCVDALIKLEEKASTAPVIVNIGAGKAVTIKELARRIVRISGKDIEIQYDLTKPVGPLSRTASIEKAKVVLGWEPKIGLDEGLRRTYQWLENRLSS